MNRTEAERRLDALEHQSDPAAAEDHREALAERFERMIEANIASGNIWSAHSPSDLIIDIDRRIAELAELASSAAQPQAGIYQTLADWLSQARRVAEDDLRVDRPVLDCAERLQRLESISHVEFLSLWFGYEAGADWDVAERIGH